MGDTGPCGPCSEIHFDRGDAFGAADIENGERFFELWNLVFMQYQVNEPGGKLEKLPAPCIDTGAGLERLASVLQGVSSNYDTDVFKPLIERVSALSGKPYGKRAEDDISIRVISDHARMTAFLVSEGVFPEKTGREYVLRRVMRRAIRHGHRLGIDDLFMHEVAGSVVDVMGETYPELGDRRELIEKVCKQEEERFRTTLGRGLDLLKETKEWLTGPQGERRLPGDVAFELTATFGFPRDLIEIIGEEDGFVIDDKGYSAAEERHRLVSGAGKIGDKAVASIYKELSSRLGKTQFLGYETTQAKTQVVGMIRDTKAVTLGKQGEMVEVVLAQTPFYGEAGGQVGDSGHLSWEGGSMTVADTQIPVPGLVVHRGVVDSGELSVRDRICAQVDVDRRKDICRAHSATHLLHMALHQVLGPHATQKGSRVDQDGLRFDFSHFEPLTAEQRVQVERIVSAKVREKRFRDHPEHSIQGGSGARCDGTVW